MGTKMLQDVTRLQSPRSTTCHDIMTPKMASSRSRGRRLGQLPRAPREGALKKREQSELETVVRRSVTQGAQSGNLAHGTRNHRSATENGPDAIEYLRL